MARYGGAIELSDDRRPEVRSGVVMYGDTKEGALSEIKGGGYSSLAKYRLPDPKLARKRRYLLGGTIHYCLRPGDFSLL